MKMYILALPSILCLAGIARGYDAIIETTAGINQLYSNQITWVERMRPNTRYKGSCTKMGVLKLSFGARDAPNKKDKVLIDMWFDRPRGFVYNIGQSRTNNGYGGDASTTKWDAEIFGRHSSLYAYSNDFHTPPAKRLLTRPNIAQTRLSVIIANNLVIWNNWGGEFNYILNRYLFALSNQTDNGKKPDYNLYFGINRIIWRPVVGRRPRVGRGLCWVAIKWLN